MKQSKLLTETRPCKDCKWIRKDINGHFCPKMLMGVIPDLKVCYYEDKGTCFEE